MRRSWKGDLARLDVLRAVGEGDVADHLEEADHAAVGHRHLLAGLELLLAGDLLLEESTLLYGLSYNSPYKPPHDKRILDEEEKRNLLGGRVLAVDLARVDTVIFDRT